MPAEPNPAPAPLPASFRAALILAGVFAVLVTLDQSHWWRIKDDYAFGWLVPVFVGYVLAERRAAIRALLGSPAAGAGGSGLAAAGAALVLAGGLVSFAFGALYRAGAGVSQPGSLALAAGLAGVVLGLVFFNTPGGLVADARGRRRDRRVRMAALFLFPALIWILSAPLVSAVENTLSLFLLRRVTAAVFFVFDVLGYPIVQEGSVLILPRGQVGVAEACSGIRSLTACLFAGSFIGAVFLDRFWKKIALIAAALALAFVTNLLRSLFLTAWAYRHGASSIEGTVHDVTGYAVLGLTAAGLLALLPLMSARNWERWLRRLAAEEPTPGEPPRV